jgi:hypothetical protein
MHIIHADLKPDNILDAELWGGATGRFRSQVDTIHPVLNQPTPYLISLLPPSDVILGLIPFCGRFMNIAVTVAELHTG